jgi:hypothetical protein
MLMSFSIPSSSSSFEEIEVGRVGSRGIERV